ncbi:glycosyl transferase, family 25 [Rhizobium sp. RU20A]|uniref:glycosyltransferase family 25 protein n=1 Tax=Rhizobium sp. RU20A TaxID=1907412 RepID=UPI000956B493|nr:glycosyltransferase family 25 protein [Rhizobium sp. RU20A]SIQ25395.1 glycosyl transferase, family 25 [Rhizobium sp. RU20A]
MADTQDFLCLVINLDGSTARMASISESLGCTGIRFERLSAFDGRRLNLADVADYDAEAARRYMGRELVGGEIGCYYSHLNAARAFLQTDLSHCLVIEDDAAPDAALKTIVAGAIAFLDRHDPDWKIVNLGNERMKIFRPLLTLPGARGDYRLCAAYYFPMTTGGILWSRAGARAFVEGHRTIFAPVDNYFRHWITRAGGGYAFQPRPVSTTDAESDITHPGTQQRSRRGRTLLYGLRKQRRLLVDKLIASLARIRDRRRTEG